MNYQKFNVLRTLYEHGELTEANKNIIQELVTSGAVLEDGLTLSDKGHKLLEPYRVDNAVLMAAGFGSRFIPYTFEKPKGLVEGFGEVLVERQIQQLLDQGIKNIYVVVGYMAEAFAYLEEKFQVTLIHNPDYEIKNNISTLKYASEKGVMKNSYVLTSDVYYTVNPFHQFEYHSWYALAFFEGYTTEWGVTMDETQKIIDVTTQGKDTYAMYGPAYFTEDFSRTIVKHIDTIYSDDAKAQYYWENVYMDHMDELDLYGNIFKDDAIIEFESFEELVALDESYNTNPRNEMIRFIADTLNVEPKSIGGIALLPSDSLCQSFTFVANHQTYTFTCNHILKGDDRVVHYQILANA